MNQELVKGEQSGSVVLSPNSRMPTSAMNQGSVAIEQERAIAEAQGQLTLAKKFPRDLTSAHGELMSACKSKGFAEIAFYTVPRAGGAVTGPSIRFMEEVARVYGNFQYGHRELSRDHNKSEIEVFAWDMEKNNRSIRQITVFHSRDTKNGQVPLRDQKDVDDKIANVASKQVRGRIQALMPKWLVEEAIAECRLTLAGNNDEPIETRIRRMTQAFSKYGVKPEHLERYLGHKLDETLVDEIIDLTGIFNAIKEGAKASDYFGQAQDDEEDQKMAEKVTEAGKKGSAKPKAPVDKAPADDGSSTNSKKEKQSSKEAKAEPAPNQKEEAEAKPADDGKSKEEAKGEPDSTPSSDEGPAGAGDDGDIF